MSITAIRTELASNIGSISGIRTYADIPDNPAMPAAVVTLANVNYDQSFQRGLVEYNFIVTVIFGRIATASAQRNLDALISTGSRSLKAAVEADRTLDGNAYDTRVTEMSNVQSATIGDITYLTADFAVTVYAD